MEDKGLAWDILIEQGKRYRCIIVMMSIVTVVAIIASVAISGMHIWYLYQYDYSCTVYHAESGDTGNAVINESGMVSINGESTENGEEEK